MSDDLHKQMEAWLKQQQAYWSQLASGKDAGEAPASWQRLFREYQQSAFIDMPEQQARLASLLAANANLFNRFGEQVLEALKNPATNLRLDDAVEQLVSYLQQHSSAAMLQQWQLPEHLSSLFKTHSFSDDLLFENPFVSGFKSLLDTPAFGSNQKFQQQSRDAMKLLLDYQEALHQYVSQYSSINQLAGRRLLEMLRDTEREIGSLGDLHGLWVDCYEHAYAETAFTAQYQAAHGRVSNALMKLRKFIQDLRDVQFEALGLATRQGLNTAFERQHKLRKQVKQLQRELAETRARLEQSAPAAEVEALRREIASLRQTFSTASGNGAPPARKPRR